MHGGLVDSSVSWSEEGVTDDELQIGSRLCGSSDKAEVRSMEYGDVFSGAMERPYHPAPQYATNATPFSSVKANSVVGPSEPKEFPREGSLWWISDIVKEIHDPETVDKLSAFATFTNQWIEERGISSAYNFSAIMQACKLYDVQHLKKEKDEFTVLVALWVVFLRAMKIHLGSNAKFKYESLSAFLHAYDGCFDKVELKEQLKLFETANWMAILLPMLVAKKSKGLVLQVIPKMLEGFGVKYVTGSGQSKATSNRVRIFENEGNVQPCKKRKWSMNKLSDPEDDSPKPLKKRDRSLVSLRKPPPEAAEGNGVVAPTGMSKSVLALAAQIERERSGDDFAKPELEKFRRESFYSGPVHLRRDWSEDYSHHFDIDIDQLL